MHKTVRELRNCKGRVAKDISTWIHPITHKNLMLNMAQSCSSYPLTVLFFKPFAMC